MKEEGERTIRAKAFQFKLKPVLEIRIRQLEAIQQRFAAQQHKVFDLKQLVLEIQEQLQEQLLVKPHRDTVDPVVSQQQFRYIQYLKMQLEHLRGAIRKEEQILDRIRQEMHQAHVKKKSLEMLQDKQKKAYSKEMETLEMKEIEDLIVSRYQQPL